MKKLTEVRRNVTCWHWNEKSFWDVTETIKEFQIKMKVDEGCEIQGSISIIVQKGLDDHVTWFYVLNV